ncbi:MAG: hypothetical protein ACHQ2E_11750, partial [Gemmatimonadales bacterium]
VTAASLLDRLATTPARRTARGSAAARRAVGCNRLFGGERNGHVGGAVAISDPSAFSEPIVQRKKGD